MSVKSSKLNYTQKFSKSKMTECEKIIFLNKSSMEYVHPKNFTSCYLCCILNSKNGQNVRFKLK